MLDASDPRIRLSAIEEALGWTKLTVADDPILKLCQSMASLLLLWLMVIALPALLIDPLPAETVPPVGKLFASRAKAQGRLKTPASASKLQRKRCFWVPEPRVVAVSGMATQAPSASL